MGGAAGKKWHDFQAEKVQGLAGDALESFLTFRQTLVLQISDLLAGHQKYPTLCEIGTGNGLFLKYLSEQFPQIKRFIGLDLNEEQIRENKHVYKSTRLEFVHGEISDCLRSGMFDEGAIFVTCGTLEYFTQKELQDLLALIRRKVNPTAVAICEPITFDLESEYVSKPRGNTAYSHNYPAIFRQAEWHAFRQQRVQIDPSVKYWENVIMVVTTETI